MDGIRLDVAYQTREWAAEGTALHFAAISTEDVEQVREYDADWNIINDELPLEVRSIAIRHGFAALRSTCFTLSQPQRTVYLLRRVE